MTINEISFFFKNIFKKNFIRYKKIGLTHTVCNLIAFPIRRLNHLNKKKRYLKQVKIKDLKKYMKLIFGIMRKVYQDLVQV